MYARVNEVVDNLAGELYELSMELHKHPELGLEEYKACAAQRKLLEKHAFTFEDHYCGMDTAYKAVYRSQKPGPRLATLSEYDALPELAHGCGHNLSAMVSVGTAIAMKEFIDAYGGEICVFGTPAEETIGGKVLMAKAGAFDDIDAVVMAHPHNQNSQSANTLAIDEFKFHYYGKPAHAAAAPHEGINALDAVINLFNMINALRQQTTPDVRIHGIITQGGTVPNIIPDQAEAVISARAAKADALETLCERIKNCARAAALSTGCRLEIRPSGGRFKDTNSNQALSLLNARQMEKLGVVLTPPPAEPLPASSDLGDVSYCCPAIQTSFEITQGQSYGLHTKEFAAAAGSEFAIQRGLTVIKGFVLTLIDLLTNPSDLEDIRTEFEKSRKKL